MSAAHVCLEPEQHADVKTGHILSQAGASRNTAQFAVGSTDMRRHAWMSYMVDKAPTEDKLLQRGVRSWEPKEHVPVMTASRSAYKPFNT